MLFTKKPRLAVGCMFVATAMLVAGCSKQQGQQQQANAQPTQVNVQVIEKDTAILRTELSGRTSAYRVAEVRPQVTGIILERNFEEGAEVKEGQPLYQIDPAVYKANVQTARAAVLQASANLKAAQAEAKRSAELVRVKAVSQAQDDTAQATYRVAQANLESAKASLDRAQIDLDYTRVNSPITGQVSLSEVTPGALVTANQANRLTVVQQLDPIYVDVSQSYEQMRKLRQQVTDGTLKRSANQDADVQLVLDTGEVYPLLGKLTFKDALVDESTGTVRVRAVFPNPDRLLMPGMYVRARLVDGVREEVVKLDQRATMRRATGEAYVYVVNAENKIESRDVSILSAEGTNWIVDGGLEAGDRVVVEGLQRVRPGAPVSIAPTAKEQQVPKSATEGAKQQSNAQQGS